MGQVGGSISDDDHGYAEMGIRLRQIKAAVKVGVDDRPHAPSGQPTDEIGTYHEFGQGNMPERSFLRAWVDEKERDIREKIADLALAQVLDGGPDWRIPFGQWAVDRIRERIWALIPPPLKIATVLRKGGVTPLVDTMQLVNAILDELEE